MGKRSASPAWWVLFGVCVAGVLGLGFWLMPRLRAATTYVPPTPTPVPPTAVPTAPPTPKSTETASPTSPPPVMPTSPLGVAPDFALPGAGGTVMTLSDQLGEGPVVLTFFQKVGG